MSARGCVQFARTAFARSKSRLFTWLAALLIFPGLASAELRWEKTELTFHPEPAAATVTADFAFTNAGGEAVTIESVQACCACMTARADRTTCPPGEKGHVSVVFDLGQRTGVQDKWIAVKIEGEPEPVRLKMVVHIPELLRLTPALVFWDAGEAAKAKKIELTLLPGTAARIAGIVAPDPRFTARLETVGERQNLIITPTQTAAPAMAVVTVECLAGTDTRRFFQAYAQVRSAVPQNPPLPH